MPNRNEPYFSSAVCAGLRRIPSNSILAALSLDDSTGAVIVLSTLLLAICLDLSAACSCVDAELSIVNICRGIFPLRPSFLLGISESRSI